MGFILFFARLYFFWWCLFFSGRLVFYLLNYGLFSGTGFLKAFYKGAVLDLSAAGYLVAPTFLIWLVSRFHYRHSLNRVSLWLNGMLTVAMCFLVVSSARLYREWGTLLNSRAIDYLASPGEAMASLGTLEFTALAGLVLFMSLFYIRWLLRKKQYLIYPPVRPATSVIQGLVAALLIFLSIRGGVGMVPVNESAAYYSSRTAENHMAVNPLWYLGNSILTRTSGTNPYRWMGEEEALAIMASMKGSCDTLRVSVPGDPYPNIILVILESFAADLAGKKVDGEEVTPFFNRLSETGLHFTNIYSSGFRTDQGLVSLLAGYPSVPDNSVLRYPSKTESLPSIPSRLKGRGYTSFFVYGGDPDFANMSLLLKSAGVDPIIGKDELNGGEKGKWGYHDEDMFRGFLDLAREKQEPFFGIALTLSLHAPFEKGNDGPFNLPGEEGKFLNAARYTDEAIAAFYAAAAKEPWFRNSLFIFVADHGHPLASARSYHDPEARKVPLVMAGPALAPGHAGMKIETIGNHHDLPATLFRMQGIRADIFPFSRNLFCPQPDSGYAWLAYDPGFGLVSRKGSFVYHHPSGSWYWPVGGEQPDPEIVLKGKAWEQILYEDFLER